MIFAKNGDLLKCDEDIIIHQVNIEGVMGGGLARQIAKQYPQTEKVYQEFFLKYNCNYNELRGKVLLTKEKKGKYIASIFSQKINFDTDYEAMEIALNKVKRFAKNKKLTVAVPYKIGCGIANGDWEKVLSIIDEVFIDYSVTIINYIKEGN